MREKQVEIKSIDFWFKIVEMLQQNWALIDKDIDSDACTVFFIDDAAGVFDQLRFSSEKEAIGSLRRNGFARLADEQEAQKFIVLPCRPFFETQHPNGTIYSSGRFWRSVIDPTDKLDSLLAYVQAEGRICPQPQRWNALWEMLPNKKRVGAGWKPPLPLILGAWWHTTHLEKMIQLREHIEYAAEIDALDEIDRFIRCLSQNDWYTGDRQGLTIPQERESGARAVEYGLLTAQKITEKIGGKKIGTAWSNEYEIDKRKIVIKCARSTTNSVGVSYHMLDRVDAIWGSFEIENGTYKIYEMKPDTYREHMIPTRSKGPSSGRVGIVRRSTFFDLGKFLMIINID
jgi:hypothetical protein